MSNFINQKILFFFQIIGLQLVELIITSDSIGSDIMNMDSQVSIKIKVVLLYTLNT